MQYETLKVTEANGIVKVVLNRPEKRNAMNPRMHEEANALVQRLRDSPTARVVVITGAGNAFCAGMDLKEYFTDLKDDQLGMDRVTRMAIEWRGRGLREIPQPTIAVVNGYCMGGGLAIVDACDLAFAAHHAEFCVSEINFRHFPAGPVTKALADRLGSREALFYSLTGKSFTASEAERIGLINRSMPHKQLESYAMEIASLIASKDKVAVRITKEAHYRSREMSWDAAMDYATAKTAQLLDLQRGVAGRKEGIDDFLGKRYRPGVEGHEKLTQNNKEQKA